MYNFCRIMLMRGKLLLRMLARKLGPQLKKAGRILVAFGADDRERSWGVASFAHMESGELEIVGPYPHVSRGPIYAVGFRRGEEGVKSVVALRLNWIATRSAPFGDCSPQPWSFDGKRDVLVDPSLSSLYELPDGTLWFMWPNGSYGVIHFDRSKYLRFAGDPKTPRVYTYF